MWPRYLIPRVNPLTQRKIAIEEDDEWQAWLEHKYHIDNESQGNIMEEQLLIQEQQMYICPLCQDDNCLW